MTPVPETEPVAKPKVSKTSLSDIALKLSKKENSIEFNISDFIEILKKAWAKWALTMALRWSKLALNINILTINTKTKIASWQVSNIQNILIMRQA